MPSPFDCKPVKSWMFVKGNPGRKKEQKKADLFEFPVATTATSNGVIKF